MRALIQFIETLVKKIRQHLQKLNSKIVNIKNGIWIQAERFNAFNFNNFNGWECSSGYRSIIIREPDGSIKRSYSCVDQPLGNIETGFNYLTDPKCTTGACVS